jgi:two-component system, cell cycle sensor histidine kinase and response regulator CckA
LKLRMGEKLLMWREKTQAPIHLLLTDMVMPEMGGAELAAFFGHGPRAIPILCMSGYSDRAWRPECRTAGFIQKPFTIDALLSRIRQSLAAPTPANTVGQALACGPDSSGPYSAA